MAPPPRTNRNGSSSPAVPPPPVTGGAVGNGLVVDGCGDGVRTAGRGDSLPAEMPGDAALRVGAGVRLALGLALALGVRRALGLALGEPALGVRVAMDGVGLAACVGLPTTMLEPETLSDGPTIGDAPADGLAGDDVHPTAKASTITTNAQSRSLPIALRLRESLQ